MRTIKPFRTAFGYNINEASYTYSRDDVYINVFTDDGVYQRSKYGINYPYVFGGEGQKEIFDKVPTVIMTVLLAGAMFMVPVCRRKEGPVMGNLWGFIVIAMALVVAIGIDATFSLLPDLTGTGAAGQLVLVTVFISAISFIIAKGIYS